MIAAAVQLVLFLVLDGREVYVNAEQIVAISTTRAEDHPAGRQLSSKVRCVISLSNGETVTVGEECASVLQRLAAP